MSFGGGGGGVDTSVSDATAKLMREQYSDYLRRYAPIEQELINAISEPIDGSQDPDPYGYGTGVQQQQQIGYPDGASPLQYKRARQLAYNSFNMKDNGGYAQFDMSFPSYDVWARQQAAKSGQSYSPYSSNYGSGVEQIGTTRKLGNTALTNRFVTEAQDIASRQTGNTADIMSRNAARYGMPMTGDNKAVMDRTMNIGGALLNADVANKTRDQVDAMNMDIANNLMSTGRGLANDASSMYGSASSLEAARNQANTQIAAQNRANTMSGIGSLIGLGLMFNI
jgi:hypothetical protein